VPRTLIYAPRARDDLAAIRRWLTQPGSGTAARRRLAAIRNAINRLRELPCEGGYRALYEIIPDTGRNETAGDVRVLRVFGPGQDRRTL